MQSTSKHPLPTPTSTPTCPAPNLCHQTTKLCQSRYIQTSIKTATYKACISEAFKLNKSDQQKICIDMYSMLRYYYGIYVKKEQEEESNEERREKREYRGRDGGVGSQHVKRVRFVVDWVYEYFQPISLKLVFPEDRPFTKYTLSKLYYPITQTHSSNTPYSHTSTSTPTSTNTIFNFLLSQHQKIQAQTQQKYQNNNNNNNSNGSNGNENDGDDGWDWVQWEWCREVFGKLFQVGYEDIQGVLAQAEQFGQGYSCRKLGVVEQIRAPWLDTQSFNKHPCSPQLNHLTSPPNCHWCYTWNPHNLTPLPTGTYILGFPIEHLCSISDLHEQINKYEQCVRFKELLGIQEEFEGMMEDRSKSRSQGGERGREKGRGREMGREKRSGGKGQGQGGVKIGVEILNWIICPEKGDEEMLSKLEQIARLEDKIASIQNRLNQTPCIIYNSQNLLNNTPTSQIHSRPKQFYLTQLLQNLNKINPTYNHPNYHYNNQQYLLDCVNYGLYKTAVENINESALIGYLLYQLHPVCGVNGDGKMGKEREMERERFQVVYERELEELDAEALREIYSKYTNNCIHIHPQFQTLINKYIPNHLQVNILNHSHNSNSNSHSTYSHTKQHSNYNYSHYSNYSNYQQRTNNQTNPSTTDTLQLPLPLPSNFHQNSQQYNLTKVRRNLFHGKTFHDEHEHECEYEQEKEYTNKTAIKMKEKKEMIRVIGTRQFSMKGSSRKVSRKGTGMKGVLGSYGGVRGWGRVADGDSDIESD